MTLRCFVPFIHISLRIHIKLYKTSAAFKPIMIHDGGLYVENIFHAVENVTNLFMVRSDWPKYKGKSKFRMTYMLIN